MKFLDSLLGKKKEARPEDGNPVLVRAMHEVALSDNPDNRKKLCQALLESMLFIPVPEIPRGIGPGLQTTTTNVQLQITGMLDHNNVRITPAFTDAEALRNWDPNTPYLGIKSQELFRFVTGTDIQAIVINPFDPIRKMIRPGGRVNRAEIEILANGVIPSRIGPQNVQFQHRANEKIAIGLPANPLNPAIEELLQSRALAFPEIGELYLFQMATQCGSSHTVIGIETNTAVSRGRGDEIVGTLGKSVQPGLKAGQSLDFMFLRGSMAGQVRKLGKRILRRPGNQE